METAMDKMRKRFDIGQPILATLFAMPRVELLEKVKSIIGSKVELNSVYDSAQVIKTSSDDVPESISIHFFEEITISVMGIMFRHELREFGMSIVEFDEHFKFQI